MRNLIFDIQKRIKKGLVNSSFNPKIEKVLFDIPYFPQSKTGSKDKKTVDLWVNNGCGIACLKMILSFKKIKSPPLFKVGQECIDFGAFKKRGKTLDGLFYKPFVKYIKERFNLDGLVVAPLTLEDVIKRLEKGKFIIASVTSEIRNPRSIPTRRGGHLILMIGYDLGKKEFSYHDPGGYQPNKKISFSDFEKFFAYRGIVIS